MFCNKYIINTQDRISKDVNQFCHKHGSRVYSMGILCVENYSIIEQNFGHEIYKFIDTKIYDTFKKVIRNDVLVSRIDYNSYLFVTILETNDEKIGFVENLVEQINIHNDPESSFSKIFAVCKVGLTEYTPNSDYFKAFNRAQVSLFECKYQKNTNFTIYSESLAKIQKHVNYADLLAMIIKNKQENRLFLEKQPIIDAYTRKRVSYECLLRITDKYGKKISASSHIKAAEEYCYINQIDKFVLIKAVEMLEAEDDLKLHINISGATLTDHEWLDLARQLFYRKNFYHRLTIEITEYSIIKDLKEANFFSKRLKELGCRLSIDDFGSGYSSYTQLRNIPADSVKIGGEYIKDICVNKNNLIFLKTLIQLAKNLGMKIIAEQIDSEEAAKLLTDLGADYLQGYLWKI